MQPSLREFSQEFSLFPFIMVDVYILPQACVSEALHLADQITDVEHPDCILFLGTLTEQTSTKNCQNTGNTLSVLSGTKTHWTTAT